MSGLAGDQQETYTLRLDVRRRPMWLDLFHEDGGRERVMLTLFKFEADRLILIEGETVDAAAWRTAKGNLPGRPKDFHPAPGERHVRRVLTREEPARRWGPKVFEKVRPAVVTLHASCKDADGQTHTHSGLGILIDPKGIIVAPRRLVAGGGTIEAELADGRRLAPKAVLSDPEGDVAVVRLESDRPLPAAAFGSTERLEVGTFMLSLDLQFREVSLELGLYTGKAGAWGKGPQMLHMDSSRSYPCERDLLLNHRGEVLGVWAGKAVVPSERVKEAVRRLLESEGR